METLSTRPAVIPWFKAYCGFMALLYLLVGIFSTALFIVHPDQTEMDPFAAKFIGSLLLIVSLTLFGAFLVPFILTPRPWLWVYGIVLICLGMSSACLLPACIPLLIFWLKPEARAWFGRDE